MTIVKESPKWRLGAIFPALAVLLAGLACHAKPNDPQKLIPFLQVELPGWKLAAGYPQAKRVQDKERSFPQAEAVFSSGKSTITVLIKEGEIAPEVGMFKMFKENDNEKGYCRKIMVRGFTAVEMVLKEQKFAFLFILVTDHCLVTMKVTEAADPKILKDLSHKIDLPKLAAMVK